tara:strand:+ start:1257 stop:3515 length:2259 start_codon:yes stop_codon:yes gene_type:complete
MLIQDLIISWGRANRYRRESRFGLIPRTYEARDAGFDGEALQILQEKLDEVLLIPANVGDIIEPVMAFIPQDNNIPIPIPGADIPWNKPPPGDPELPPGFPQIRPRHFEVVPDHGAQHPHGDPNAIRNGLSRHRICFEIHDAEWVKQNKDVPPELDTYGGAFGIGSDFWNRLPDGLKINPESGDMWTEEEWISHLLDTGNPPLNDQFSEHLKPGAKGKGWEVCKCCPCCPPIACDAYWYWERLEQTVGGVWQSQTWPMCPPPAAGPMCDFPLITRIIFPQDLRNDPRLGNLFQAGDILPGPKEFRGVNNDELKLRMENMRDGPTGARPNSGSLPRMPAIQGEDVKNIAQNPDLDINVAAQRMRDIQLLWSIYNKSFSNIYIDLDQSRPDLELLGDFNNLDAQINRENTPLWPSSPDKRIQSPNKFIKPFTGLILKYKPENPNTVFRRLWNNDIKLNPLDPEAQIKIQEIMRVVRPILEMMDWGGMLRGGPGQEIDDIMQLLRADWQAHFARFGMNDIPTDVPIIDTSYHMGTYMVRADFDAGVGGSFFPDVHNGPHRCFCILNPDWVSQYPEVNPAVDILSMAEDRSKKYVQDLEVKDRGNGWIVCAGCPCPDEGDNFAPLERGLLKKNLEYAERWLKAAPGGLIPQGEAGEPGEPGDPGEPGEVEGEEVFAEIKKAARQPRSPREEPNFPSPFGAPIVPAPEDPKQVRKQLDKALKQNPEAAKAAIKQIQKFVPNEMNAFLNRPENKKFKP